MLAAARCCASTSEVWPGHVALRSLVLDLQLLQVDREGDVRDAAAGERGAAGEIGDVLDVRRAHDAHVVDGDVREHACRARHPAACACRSGRGRACR